MPAEADHIIDSSSEATDDSHGGCAIKPLLIMLLFNLLFGGLAIQYLAQHWFSLDPAFFPWCFLIGLLWGGFTVPLALITLIILLFV